MRVEVTTKFKFSEGIVIIDVALVPRGSGNRAAARRLAQSFRNHDRLKPHIVKVTCGSSRVLVHFRSSLELMSIIREIRLDREIQDVPGQLQMFEPA